MYTCDYYIRTRDATLWAIRCEDGKPDKAVGPLGPGQQDRPAVEQDFAGNAIDARFFNLREFKALGQQWVRQGPTPPRPPKTRIVSARNPATPLKPRSVGFNPPGRPKLFIP